MPTRAEKSREAYVWRVTLSGQPAFKRRACRTLEQNCGQRGNCQVVFVEMAGEDVVVLRWDPPRKYDTVVEFIQQHIKKDLFQVAPGTADDRKEDEKEDGVDVLKMDDAAGKGDDALDEVASLAASVGQRFSGGYLPLKLQALVLAEAGLATPGLRVFEDLRLGEGSNGMVCQAEYRGEAAAAKVFTFTGRGRKQCRAARCGE